MLLQLGERRVIVGDARLRQNFRDRLLVTVGALAQIDGGEVEAEHLHRANQGLQALRGDHLAVVQPQRLVDRDEIGEKGPAVGVGRARRHRVPHRLPAGQMLQSAGEARVDADQRAAVRLVVAVRIVVARAVGQILQRSGGAGVFARDRKLRAELMHLDEIKAQGHLGLHLERGLQRGGGDVGVAVAVAADPCAHAQERRHAQPFDAPLDVGVDMRNLAQEGRAIIAQRVFDFVAHGEARLAQQLGLPHLRDARAQLRVVLLEFVLGAQMFARREQREDRMFGVEQTLAPNLGRMRGEHGRDPPARENLGDLAGAHGRLAQMGERAVEAGLDQARLFAGGLGPRPLLQRMQILGDIAEMQKIAEGANDRQRLLGREVAQQLIELAVGLGVAKIHRLARP